MTSVSLIKLTVIFYHSPSFHNYVVVFKANVDEQSLPEGYSFHPKEVVKIPDKLPNRGTCFSLLTMKRAPAD